MKTMRFLSVAVICALMAATAVAQPRGERQGGRGQGGERGGGLMMLLGDSPMKRFAEMVGKLDLTSDQKEKLADLKKEYEPKFKAQREKASEILTDDQKKVVAEAKEELKGATGREAFQKVGEKLKEVKLTDEQKEKMQPIGKETRELFTEARSKVMDVLTDEQKEKLKEMMPQGPRGPRGGDQKKDKPKEKEST